MKNIHCDRCGYIIRRCECKKPVCDVVGCKNYATIIYAKTGEGTEYEHTLMVCEVHKDD